MKRVMVWKMMLSGRVVTCTACSWRVPVIGNDIDAADKEFDEHVCADHPPLKNIEKPSTSK